MNTSDKPLHESEGKPDPRILWSLSGEDQKGYLMDFFDLASIESGIENLWYLILKRKDESVAIYSLRTQVLISFPDGEDFIALSGIETDQHRQVYMSLGGTRKDDDIIGIRAFFILEGGIIRKVPLREDQSFCSAMIQYGISERILKIVNHWEGIGQEIDGATRLIESIGEYRYQIGNTTQH